MKKIGLTGNIGSGKTTIATIFEVLGVAVFNADNEAKRLMIEDENLKNQLITAFGEYVYINGQLNRTHLSQIAFENDEVLNQLNAIVHPVVQNAFTLWLKKQTGSYIIKEAAILFESNSHTLLDSVICVSCPESIRINRLLKRDNTNKKNIMARINKQWQEERKIELSDHIIVNDDKRLVIPQVLAIHNALNKSV